jgi:hypothetical protein
MPDRTAVLIIGVGRSGTSALTRVLSLCGCALPDKLLGAIEMNPKGCWEPLDALVLNNRFMFRYGTGVLDPGMPLEELTVDAGDKEKFIQEIQSYLATCPPSPIVLIKEPAITDLMEFWLEAAAREDYSVKVIIPIRHPTEVCASLTAFFAKKMPISSVLASAFWLKRNLLAERKSRRLPRVFVDYSELLRDWRSQIARISRSLSMELVPDHAAIEGFLVKDLHRQKGADAIQEPFGDSWLSQVYEALFATSKDSELDTEGLDAIYMAYRSNETAFRLAHSEFGAFLNLVRESASSAQNRSADFPTYLRDRDF